MKPAATSPSSPCPGCGDAMRALVVERTPHGQCEIDLCDGCHALWFDAFESLQLTPAATLSLFREVRAAQTPARRSLPQHLRCPRCRATLAPTQDLQRTTRFSYWRCPKSHGRFTPFLQFLREKDFVRPLSPAEIEALKRHFASVRCNGCGAPVELARDMVCRYCRAPIEALDPAAVGRSLDILRDAQRQRETIDVDRLADAILAQQRRPAWQAAAATGGPAVTSIDLVGAGVALIIDALSAD